jgi:16S rRNA (adenine1518-N6/adenine1519-N6)-dimethyltransferase
VTVHSPADIDGLLARHGLSPRRQFGQNFVADPNTVRKIARLAAVGPGDYVVEVGPGLGSLTLALAETGGQVLAVEVDRDVTPVLRKIVGHLDNVTVLHADAMRLDWTDALSAHPLWTLVANLPYNIATPLVCDLLDGVPQIQRMLVMVQREVGERMCASPSTPAYGAVTVKVVHWATARIAAAVPATVFVPRPNVQSALVEITRRPQPASAADPEVLFALVRDAFGQRRKMMRRSLAGVVDADTFVAAGIDSQRRPESLDVYEWGRLAIAHAAAGTGG